MSVPGGGRPGSAAHSRQNMNNVVNTLTNEDAYVNTINKFNRPTSSYGSKGGKTISTAAATNPQYNATLMSQKYKNTVRQQRFSESMKKNRNSESI